MSLALLAYEVRVWKLERKVTKQLELGVVVAVEHTAILVLQPRVGGSASKGALMSTSLDMTPWVNADGIESFQVSSDARSLGQGCDHERS